MSSFICAAEIEVTHEPMYECKPNQNEKWIIISTNNQFKDRYRKRRTGLREQRTADIKRQVNHAANWSSLERLVERVKLDWPDPVLLKMKLIKEAKKPTDTPTKKPEKERTEKPTDEPEKGAPVEDPTRNSTQQSKNDIA